MRTFARPLSAFVPIIVAATALAAQPGPGIPGRGESRLAPMPGGVGVGVGAGGGASPIFGTADFLLAHTGDLALTDAQVVRLAAISRRVDARRKAMASRLDSARATQSSRDDSGAARGPGRPGGPPPEELERLRDQQRADVRDAIAVLTADQQATAWMMVAARGTLGGGPGAPFGATVLHGARRMDDGPPDRGGISRPPAPRDVPRRRPDGAERVEP
jgi:hypothetical protein